MEKTQQSGGIGCFTVLGLIFITLKLTGHIDWSWALVLLPFYGPVAIFLLVGVIMLAAGATLTRKPKLPPATNPTNRAIAALAQLRNRLRHGADDQ
jgi:hypothetical protein